MCLCIDCGVRVYVHVFVLLSGVSLFLSSRNGRRTVVCVKRQTSTAHLQLFQ
jgi:uncharacterized membrane protein